MRLAWIAWPLLCLSSCGDGSSPVPAGDGSGEPDAGGRVDAAAGAPGADGAGPTDTTATDAGAAASDTGAPDTSDAGSEPSAPDGAQDAAVLDAPADTTAPDSTPDAPVADTAHVGDGGTYRNSLSVCWTDAQCPRVMAIGHGGAWDPINAPYDSNAAIAAAYAIGLEGVKIDVRVTKDNVPVISHSSPIEMYESLDCSGKKIEEMTAAEVTKCHRFPSLTETFQRLDDVLSYLRGKMVAQLCVKRSTDYARTIEVLHGLHAEDFAFLEISTAELQNLIPAIPGSASIWYLVNIESDLAQVDTLLNVVKNPRAFMFEIDPSVQLGNLVTARLHPAGVRSFTYDSSATAGVAELQALYQKGFDVVSAQTGANNVKARIAVNQSRGVSPP
jgi:hypothetical protein